jgi:hypothetical protein
MVVTTPSRAPDAFQPRYLRAPVPVHFPEAERVPESKCHLRQKTILWQILELALRERAAIGCDQFVYWDPTDPRQCLAPDAFVRLGAPDDQFRTWKVWERGAPDVAVEIFNSMNERDRDRGAKLEKYRRLGVRELVYFDSECDPPLLRVWEAVDGDLVERAIDGLLAPSRILQASWVVVPDDVNGSLLRLSHDSEGKNLWPTPVENERRAAEERIRQLEAELQRRGG